MGVGLSPWDPINPVDWELGGRGSGSFVFLICDPFPPCSHLSQQRPVFERHPVWVRRWSWFPSMLLVMLAKARESAVQSKLLHHHPDRGLTAISCFIKARKSPFFSLKKHGFASQYKYIAHNLCNGSKCNALPRVTTGTNFSFYSKCNYIWIKTIKLQLMANCCRKIGIRRV